MRKCSCCENKIPYFTEHLVSDDGEDHICSDCYETATITYFYIGGEYVGNDNEGDYSIIDEWEDERKDEQ